MNRINAGSNLKQAEKSQFLGRCGNHRRRGPGWDLIGPGSSHKFHHKLNRRVKQWQQGAKNRPANAKRPKELQPRGKRKQRAEKRKKAFGTSCLTFRIYYDTRKKSSAATLDFF